MKKTNDPIIRDEMLMKRNKSNLNTIERPRRINFEGDISGAYGSASKMMSEKRPNLYRNAKEELDLHDSAEKGL